MATLSKAYKPDSFEQHNSLKLSITNIRGLHQNFFIVNLFLNQNLLTFLLCVRQTWMTQLILAIDSRNSSDSYLCFRLALLHSVSYFSFFYRSPSSSLCTVFHSISSNIMRFSRLSHLLMFLFLETLISIIRTGLPILVELIELVNSVIIFLSQITLLRWLTFLLRSKTVILIVLLFWIYNFLLMLLLFYKGFPSIGKF